MDGAGCHVSARVSGPGPPTKKRAYTFHTRIRKEGTAKRVENNVEDASVSLAVEKCLPCSCGAAKQLSHGNVQTWRQEYMDHDNRGQYVLDSIRTAVSSTEFNSGQPLHTISTVACSAVRACAQCWYVLLGISRSNYYNKKNDAAAGVLRVKHGGSGALKAPRGIMSRFISLLLS